MWEIPPQQIPQDVDSRVFSVLSGAMPALVFDGHRGQSAAELRDWAERAVVPGTTHACLLAGLWLLEGNLEEAHRLCQDVPTVLGSGWHAVVHRQKGDFWNSKYWWRRTCTGGAGVGIRWQKLQGELKAIVRSAPRSVVEPLERLARSYDPARFVDLVEVNRGNAEAREVLLDVQRWEWASLFLETWNGREGKQ